MTNANSNNQIDSQKINQVTITVQIQKIAVLIQATCHTHTQKIHTKN